MNLPNVHFKDFSIDFKEINPEDFIADDKMIFDVGKKIIIEPNDDGYIHDALQDKIVISDKNTVVVNAQVGCGKSFTIIKLIKRIYDTDKNSLILVVTPFVSLVQQYVDELTTTGEIPKSQIFNYLRLGRESEPDYIKKRIQVVTVNTLLGNPGDDGYTNSNVKKLYLNELVTNCELYNRKVYFVYDEIHDAVSNFKEEFIFNLWKWRNVIHKNFIISATYSEASKIVIKYLAELTDKKIQIIEASRKIIPHKQSKLFLHFSNDYNYSSTTDELVNLVKELLNSDKEIDILSYSKTLAKSIITDKEGIGKYLKDRFGKLNDCTSQLVSNQRMENLAQKNRFNKEMCNVGTNFKTGVNITKENHALIIIMPPRSSRMTFGNKYGIFSDGTNNIIQALARQRTQGEIHIILPRPDKFDFDSLDKTKMSEAQKVEFENYYKKIEYFDGDLKIPVTYMLQDEQYGILKKFYNRTLNELKQELVSVKPNKRAWLPRLEYPPFEIFTLNRGEGFLSDTNKFYGADLSAYITYCSITNQFINCELHQINYKEILLLEEGKIQKTLFENFKNKYDENYYNLNLNSSNFNMFYYRIRDEFFNSFLMKIRKKDGKDWKNILESRDRLFEIQFLMFCNTIFHQGLDSTKVKIDKDYTRGNYFLESIAIANSLILKGSTYDNNQKKRIKAFQNLSKLREKLIGNVAVSKSGKKYQYLPVKPFSDFIKITNLKEFDGLIKYFLEDDPYIKEEIFSFKRNFIGKDSDKKIESLYTILLNDFFEFDEFKDYPKKTIDGKLVRVKPIKSIIPLPDSKNILNLVIDSDFDKDYINAIKESVKKIDQYKDFEEYEVKIKSMFNSI